MDGLENEAASSLEFGVCKGFIGRLVRTFRVSALAGRNYDFY